MTRIQAEVTNLQCLSKTNTKILKLRHVAFKPQCRLSECSYHSSDLI